MARIVRRRPWWGQRRWRAFTLVELLVVVAIIGLLLAILLPSLQAVKELAYDAKCRANLHHLHELLFAPTGLQEKVHGLPSYSGWVTHVTSLDSAGLLKCPKDDTESSAGALGMDGSIQMIDPPDSCVFNDYESNTVIHGFIEREGIPLPGAVTVDISKPGRYDSSYNTTSKTIPAGTVVDSYFLFFDPVGSQSATASGKVTLAADILGFIVLSGSLDATDAMLGAPGTRYPGGIGARGFESGQEIVTFEKDGRTLTIHQFYSTYPGENIRILTERGGISSYGMNRLVLPDAPRPQQLLLVEYNSSVADPRNREHNEQLQARHFDHVNVLYTGGDAVAMAPEDLTLDNKDWLARSK